VVELIVRVESTVLFFSLCNVYVGAYTCMYVHAYVYMYIYMYV